MASSPATRSACQSRGGTLATSERCPSGLRSATGNRVPAERWVAGSNPALSASPAGEAPPPPRSLRDLDLDVHPGLLVARDGAIEVVCPRGERHLQSRFLPGTDERRVGLAHLRAVDRQVVRQVARIRELEGVCPGLERRRRERDRKLLLGDLDRLAPAAGRRARGGRLRFRGRLLRRLGAEDLDRGQHPDEEDERDEREPPEPAGRVLRPVAREEEGRREREEDEHSRDSRQTELVTRRERQQHGAETTIAPRWTTGCRRTSSSRASRTRSSCVAPTASSCVAIPSRPRSSGGSRARPCSASSSPARSSPASQPSTSRSTPKDRDDSWRLRRGPTSA